MKSNPSTSLGRARETRIARSALAARWSLRSFAEPAVAPVLGSLRFPEKRATLLPGGREHFVEDVSAELSFGHGLDKICGKLCGQKRLEFHLLHFALQLLRALLGFLFQNLDLALHAGDGFFALRNLQLQFFFRIVLCFVTNGAERLLNTSFDGQLEFALLVVELPLLANELGLRLLGVGQFVVLGLDDCSSSASSLALPSSSSETSLRAFFASSAAIVCRSRRTPSSI